MFNDKIDKFIKMLRMKKAVMDRKVCAIAMNNIYTICDSGVDGIWKTKFVPNKRYFEDWPDLDRKYYARVTNEALNTYLRALQTIKVLEVSMNAVEEELSRVLSLFGKRGNEARGLTTEGRLELLMGYCVEMFDSFEELYSTAYADFDIVLSNDVMLTQGMVKNLRYISNAEDWKTMKRMLRELPDSAEAICEFVKNGGK